MNLLLRVSKYYINLEANTSIKDALLIRNEAHFSGPVFNKYSKKAKKTLEGISYQVSFNKKKRLSNELIVKLQYLDKKLNVGDERILKVELNLEFVNPKYYNKEQNVMIEETIEIILHAKKVQNKELSKVLKIKS